MLVSKPLQVLSKSILVYRRISSGLLKKKERKREREKREKEKKVYKKRKEKERERSEQGGE